MRKLMRGYQYMQADTRMRMGNDAKMRIEMDSRMHMGNDAKMRIEMDPKMHAQHDAKIPMEHGCEDPIANGIRESRKIWGILLVALIGLCLTACARNSANSANVTLTIMGKETDLEKSYMTRIFEQYEQSTGNHIKLISVEDSKYEEAAQKKMEAKDAPDILLHFNNADLARYDVPSQFCFLNDEEWVGDLTDGARAYCADSDGNLLGLPFWENSVSGCYYNKTLLDSLGLKPATTQEEFDVLCQALSDTGYTPICWPADGCSWMFQFGLDPIFADHPDLLRRLNNNETTYADIPQIQDMAQWLGDAAGKGWFGSNYQKTGWSDISSALGSGEAAMTFIWDTWFYTDFEDGNTYGADDFALMPVFMNTVDDGTYEGGNLNMMMVNKNGSQVDEAENFLSFCATAENYNAAFDGISTVNCFQGQTTNIQSKMVTEATASIKEHERVSTAASKIVGYNAEDVVLAFQELFSGKTDAEGCVELMDRYRIEEARKTGVDGF